MKKSIAKSWGMGLLTLGLPLVLTACATTGGLKPEQCQSVDWQGIGFQDGLLGRDASFISRHAERCGKVGVNPNQALWEQGRQSGLKRYCTPLRAYQLGREGINYSNVCPSEQMLELIKAHDEGYHNYQREQTLNEFWYDEDPFWHTGWGSPFYRRHGYGRVGGWMRVPTPRTVPDYIDMAEKSTNMTSTNPTQSKRFDTTTQSK